KQEPTCTQPVSVSVEDKKVLVVDDVADTGESLKLVTSHLNEKGASDIKIATIYYKPWSIIVPHYYQKITRSWIVFPWEIKEATRKIVEKFRDEGRGVEEAKEKLISSGLNRELAERFIKEIFGA
ncbi:phosphoribosyltransferase, partial [Candidatus Bathyarchaeota archaeon]|nr:phosphoribosyltransferase [Candidatus Bathyarchaeota archaeon]